MGEVPSLPPLGAVLAGKYRIVRRIGEGGMGVVYEALNERIRQRVAIKMLLPEMLEIPDVVSRFTREARAAGQLRSDNIAKVLDVDQTEYGLPYMVMEYLDGADLSDWIVRTGVLSVPAAVDYVLQACNAMRTAHRHGIVHRDLKPSNLFLADVDGRTVLKVLDFGISKVEDDREARVTDTQSTVGTPLYMSPEQIRSAKSVDARTDIWSLGIILYELLVGKTPYEGSTTAAAVAICVDPVPSLRAMRPDVSPELEQIILLALEKDRDRRFQSVEALATALLPFAASGTAWMPHASASVRTTAPSSTPSLGDLADARTETGGAALVALGAKRPGAATAPPWTTRPGIRKPARWMWMVAAAAVLGCSLLLGVGLAVARWRRVAASHEPRATTPASVMPGPTPSLATATATAPAAVTTTPAPSARPTPSPFRPAPTRSPPVASTPPPSPPASRPVPTPTAAPTRL